MAIMSCIMSTQGIHLIHVVNLSRLKLGRVCQNLRSHDDKAGWYMTANWALRISVISLEICTESSNKRSTIIRKNSRDLPSSPILGYHRTSVHGWWKNTASSVVQVLKGTVKLYLGHTVSSDSMTEHILHQLPFIWAWPVSLMHFLPDYFLKDIYGPYLGIVSAVL